MEQTKFATYLEGIEQLTSVGVTVGLVLIGAFVLSSWLTRMQRRLRTRGGPLEQLVAWLPVVQIAAWAVALLVAGGVVLRAPLVVSFIVLVPAAIAVVVASRDLVRDTVAGVVLAFEHSIIAGDAIDIAMPNEHINGRVVSIGVRRTTLRRPDGDDVLIPNHTFLTATIRTSRAHQQDAVIDIELNLDEAFTTAEFPRVSALAREAASISRFASPHRRPEVHLSPSSTGRYRLTVQAFAFSPEFARHLRTDVVAMFNEALHRITPGDE